MIEIVFSESACGSLKVAQHFGQGKYQNGPTAIFVSHEDGSKPTKEEIKAFEREELEKYRLRWEKATPMGGNSADIYGFDLMLSIGDISENLPGIKRKKVLECLFGNFPNDEGHQAANEILKKVNEGLKTVREQVKAGESLRIWYSNNPDEMCGFYWFMWQLNEWEVHDLKVFIVKLPEWEADENGNIVQRSNWGEVMPEEWHRYLALQKPALPVFIQSCAFHWQDLQKENTPLRVVLNGQLVSVSEKLYDDFILREIAEEDDGLKEISLIGSVNGKYQLGMGILWLALRIEEMIRDGVIEVVSSGDGSENNIYERVLKRSTHKL